VLNTALSLLQGNHTNPLAGIVPDGRKLLVCSSQTRFAEQTGIALWRVPGSRDWDSEEHVLASSAGGVIRMILDHDSIQREMARQARTDPLTGLLNRRAFLDELARRVDRLDREGMPGTLMFADLDHFKQLNDLRGHEAGDMALCVIANLLRDTVRPSDLVARLGGDEFALWLDGADDLSAAERAEHLRIAGPRVLASLTEGTGVQLSLSIGIATRWPSRAEDIETVLHRADQAMYQVKRSGRGHWRVAHPHDA
jgi:diguanylate cyclase (GGDEF)-like protein